MARAFFDTNIVVYAADETSGKAIVARALIAAGGVVSVQVLNEFLRVSLGKMKASFEISTLALVPIRQVCEIVPLTLETHDLAVEIVRTMRIPVFDANIVAAAELAGCDVLYTEDMHHGQRIGRVLIQNPFLAI